MKLLIGYDDFVRICAVSKKALHDEEIAPGLRLATDGIYSTFPDDPIKDVWLTPEERAILAEHPKKDLSKPVLAFPATPREFESFIKNEGLTCREWIENYRAWLLKHAPDLVEFPVAQEALEARYDACAEEIALWVYHSELTAYEDDSVLRYPTADLLEDPQTTQLIDQHDFPNTDDPKHDLLTVLNELYFDRAQIKNFKPQTRWLNFEQTRAYLGLSENDAKAYLLSKLRKQEILWCSHPLHYVERGIRDGKYPITLGLNPDYEVQRKLSQWEKSRIGQLPLSHADPLARLKLIISDPVTVDEFLLDYPTDDRQGLRDKIAKAIASGLLHSARLPIAVAGSDGPGYKTYFSRQQVNDWLKQDKSDNDIRAENLLPTELVGHGDTIESKQNSSGAIPGPKELSRRFFQAEKCKDFAARNTALQELFMHYYRQSKKKQVAILETRNTLVNSPHGFSKITPERIRRLVRVQKL